MDFAERLDYQLTVEKHLETHQVYDLFEYMLRSIIIDRPEDPIEYLKHKLTLPKQRRVFIVGASGPYRRELSREIAGDLNLEFISSYELLQNEVQRTGGAAEEILHCWKTGALVPDAVVLLLLTRAIADKENAGKSYVLEGAPRTRVQCLSLQKSGFLPDKVFILPITEESHNEGYLSQQSVVTESSLKSSYLSNTVNLRAVEEIFPASSYSLQLAPQLKTQILQIISLKQRSHAPRSPPQVILLGPTGSGKSTQLQKLVQKYGLTAVSLPQLTRDLSNRAAPAEETAKLLAKRLSEQDCKLNGWVLEAFPVNSEQAAQLRELGIDPSLVCFLETAAEVLYERVENRRLDPQTGTFYSENVALEDPEVLGRLITLPSNSHLAVKSQISEYNAHSAALKAAYAGKALVLDAQQDSEELSERVSEWLESTLS